MKTDFRVLIVHPDADIAVQWAQDFADLGFRTLVNQTMIAAIGTLRKNHVDALVVWAPRADITHAENFLADGEDLPLCVVVGGETAPIGLRSRSVISFDSTVSAQTMAPCMRTMLDLVVPDNHHRTLPLRAPGLIAAGKFTAWLTLPPSRSRSNSAW